MQLDYSHNWRLPRKAAGVPSLGKFLSSISLLAHQLIANQTAWMMYLTALLHTFPFVQREVRMGTWRASYNSDAFWWTGMVALAFQVCISLFCLH